MGNKGLCAPEVTRIYSMKVQILGRQIVTRLSSRMHFFLGITNKNCKKAIVIMEIIMLGNHTFVMDLITRHEIN